MGGSATRHKAGTINNVGAGLPAIQAPRWFWQTEVMLSQASQLPQKPAPTFDLCCPTARHCARHCGSKSAYSASRSHTAPPPGTTRRSAGRSGR
ncbi:hypothetical protein F7R12_05740 [Pseudomonas tolaasii]|nr:hypothetical protein F7R12_05740 [Pseudomonas tolaasii]